MNIHGHCYVLPLAAVGAAPQLTHALSPNTNMNEVNNSQLSAPVNCGINPMSMPNNGTMHAQSNAGCGALQGNNYPSMSQETSAKYLLGAQNLLPNLLQEQQNLSHRQPYHSLIQLNPNTQINHALNLAQQQQHQHHQHLLSIPYQANNLQTASALAHGAFHPFFATPSLPRSTSNLSNLSNFSSQHQSSKTVQQLAHQVAASVHVAASSDHHQQQLQHNLQNCTQQSTNSSNHPQHGHQHIQGHLLNPRQQHLQNVSSQPVLQPSEQTSQLYNPYFTSASILSAASSLMPKAPLLQTPATVGKVRKPIFYNFIT